MSMCLGVCVFVCSLVGKSEDESHLCFHLLVAVGMMLTVQHQGRIVVPVLCQIVSNGARVNNVTKRMLDQFILEAYHW